MKNTNNLEERITKLEEKFDALSHYLKLEVVAEKEDADYYRTLVAPYSKARKRLLDI